MLRTLQLQGPRSQLIKKQMIFREKKTDAGAFSYSVEDVFGVIEIDSPDRLGAKELDMITVGILQAQADQGTIEGTSVSFRFKKKGQWEDIPPPEPKAAADPPPAQKQSFIRKVIKFAINLKDTWRKS